MSLVFGSDSNIEQGKYQPKLGVECSLSVIPDEYFHDWLLFWVARATARIAIFVLESGLKAQRHWSWELNPLKTVLSVIQELHLPERTKNTMWPENLEENSGSSSVRMKKWDMDFKGLLFAGRKKFLTQQT